MRFVDKHVNPDKIKSGDDNLIGKSGEIVVVGTKKMVRVEGQLCALSATNDFGNGTSVIVKESNNGVLDVEVV